MVYQNAQPLEITNFQAIKGSPVGHLNELTISGEKFDPQFNFLDPLNPNPSSPLPLVAILTDANWDEQPGGLLRLEGRIPAKSKGIFQDLTSSNDKKANVTFKMNWYMYDTSTKQYFKSFHTDDQEIQAHLSLSEKSYASNEKATGQGEYVVTDNHYFTLYLYGSDEVKQNLIIGFTPDRKKALPFGTQMGG